MTELATHDERPKRSNGAERGPVLVSGNALATHFGVSRQHVERLTAEGVIERRSDGKFDQDVSRLKYMTHLRAEHRRSPRAGADAELASARRAAATARDGKERTVRRTSHRDDRRHDGRGADGDVSMPARCAPRGDLVMRRAIERVVFEVRTEIANIAQQKADKYGEPPLSEQG